MYCKYHKQCHLVKTFRSMVTITKKLVNPKRLELHNNATHIQNPRNKCKSMIFVKNLQAKQFGYNSRLKLGYFIALNSFLVTVTKRHVSQRPFELESNVRYFWNPENDFVQLVYFLHFQAIGFYRKLGSKSDHIPPKIIKLCTPFLSKL